MGDWRLEHKCLTSEADSGSVRSPSPLNRDVSQPKVMMINIEQQINQRYLQALDDPRWDEEDPKLDFGIDALPYFVTAFQEEKNEQHRSRLIRVIWQFRDSLALPCLADALRDQHAVVWKEALDGLVTLGGQEALAILNDARVVITKYNKTMDKISWIDEAIEQVQDGMKAG